MEILLADPRATVLRADWRELTEIPVDVTLTDPPFTDAVQSNIRSCDTRGKVRVKKWTPGFDSLDVTGYGHVQALLSQSARWVLCFCALEQFGAYQSAAGLKQYLRSWIWRKHQAAPQLSGDRPANSCEGIAVMHRPDRGRKRWNGHGRHAFWRVDGPFVAEDFPDWTVDSILEYGRIRAEKEHPTQKPPPLCEHLVELFTEPGELVYDPFCGSGEIPLAALRLGRRVLCCDIDPKWAGRTAERIAECLKSLPE